MKLKTAIDYWSFIFKGGKFKIAIYGALYYDEYIQFLKQLLQLWMFIPCDKEGKPLEKPVNFDKYANKNKFKLNNLNVSAEWIKECKEYQQACDRVLFEGFEQVGEWLSSPPRAISYVDGKFKLRGQTVKTVDDLSGKVDLVEKVAEQFKY